MRFWLVAIVRALLQQVRAEVQRSGVEPARAAVIDRVAELSALAHVDGALRVHEMARSRTVLARGEQARPIPRVPAVPFAEAVDNLAARQPQLARSAARIRDLYADPDGKYFALAAAPTRTCAARVQDAMTRALETGQQAQAGEIVSQLTGWSRSYGEMVVRTNTVGAEARGRIAQARRMPDVFPVLEVVTAGDANVRPTHAAMEGFRAAVDWPGWQRWAHPPFRADPYNCRCGIRLVSRFELEQEGLWSPRTGLHPSLRDPRIPVGAQLLEVA